MSLGGAPSVWPQEPPQVWRRQHLHDPRTALLPLIGPIVINLADPAPHCPWTTRGSRLPTPSPDPRASSSSFMGSVNTLTAASDVPRTRRGIFVEHTRPWFGELCACFLVLATPLIALGNLYGHNGEPMPRWPFGITAIAIDPLVQQVVTTKDCDVLDHASASLPARLSTARPKPLMAGWTSSRRCVIERSSRQP